MIIDTNGVEVEENERQYIKREGKITLKAVKVTEHTTRNGNPAFKVHFQDKIGHYAIDEFVVTDNALWKIKTLTKALKLPNIVDTNLFIDRYVKATFKAKNTPNGGVIYEIKKYEASPLTNTYEPPAPQVVYENAQQQQYQAPQQQQGTLPETPAQIDISEDEIPF